MNEAMKQQFGLIKRPWGVYYLKNKTTGDQTSLKTRDPDEAQRLLQAHNDTENQPHFNLALARVYMNGADPKLGTRTWQEVMEHILEKKIGETHRRWEVAIKDKNFDCIRNLPVAETRPEHFDQPTMLRELRRGGLAFLQHRQRPGASIRHPALRCLRALRKRSSRARSGGRNGQVSSATAPIREEGL